MTAPVVKRASVGQIGRIGEAARVLAEEVLRLIERLPAAAPFVAEWPELQPSREIAPARLPVLDQLGDLPRNATPATQTIVQHLVEAADQLAWRQTYAASDFGAEFLRRYGWTELIGLRGPIASEAIACGFLLLGPGIDYPAHAHEAEELYLPLSGTALWRRGDEPWQLRTPGPPIHHPSWLPHAMQTAAEPLLALYVWRGGDLAAKSKIMPE